MNELNAKGAEAASKKIDEYAREIAETDFDSLAGLAVKMHVASKIYWAFYDGIGLPNMDALKGLGECATPWVASRLWPCYRKQWEAVFGIVAVDQQSKAA